MWHQQHQDQDQPQTSPLHCFRTCQKNKNLKGKAITRQPRCLNYFPWQSLSRCQKRKTFYVLTSSLISLLTDNARSSSKPAAAANEIPRQAEKPPLLPAAPTIVPTSHDIIMGRGPWNRNHPGNLQLKDMLERERDLYERVNRYERMRVVDSMLNELYDDLGGRFLYKQKTSKTKKPGATQPDETTMPRQTPVSTTDDVWLKAKREKAHNKITRDFRNLRRPKYLSPKANQAHSQPFPGYSI
jgi:hypothetical protein